MQIALTNAQGQDIPIDIQDNRDGTFTVEYLTPSPGDHRVTVLYAGAEIPQSPIVVAVQPLVDVTKVKVDGLEPSKCYLSFILLIYIHNATYFIVTLPLGAPFWRGENCVRGIF